MQKLFLRRHLANDELDIVDQQDVNGTQPCLKLHDFLAPHRGYKFHHEFFGGHIQNLCVGIYLSISMADSMHQVGFALARGGLQIERVEQGLVYRRHALCGTQRQNIGLALHEIGEGHPRVKRRPRGLCLTGFLRDRAFCMG